jgi:glutamate/tyrosine decarboxylase-like PLP-dependent enzyme
VASTVSLAAARHHVLAEVGYDVEELGLIGSPGVRVVASVERHVTIDRSLRFLGLGTANLEPVSTDDQGAIRIADLQRVLAMRAPGPTIVCLQSGNVNSGACDDLATAAAIAHDHGAWVHVDGAFGLWAAANPATRRLMNGIEMLDSWAVDGSVGEYGWAGAAKTYYWVDPAEELVGMFMSQCMTGMQLPERDFRSLVYQAIDD